MVFINIVLYPSEKQNLLILVRIQLVIYKRISPLQRKVLTH